MTFNDIFKSSFLESITEFSAADTLIAMVAALVIGMFIFVVYKKTFNSVMYSTGFAMTLVGMTMVTTLVILAVTSNVVLSLGMVGALSIVRFRAAIKEPMEIVYLFWAVAAGIVIGAGMLPLAVIGSAIIGVILILFANKKIHDNPYLLILNCQDEKCRKYSSFSYEGSSEKTCSEIKNSKRAGNRVHSRNPHERRGNCICKPSE